MYYTILSPLRETLTTAGVSAKKKPTLQDAVSDDLNYKIWAPITKFTLLEKGLWGIVENGVPPNPSKIPEITAKIQPQEVSEWRDFAVKDMKALQVLQSSLPDSVFRKTLETTSSKDLWDSLEEANEKAKLQKKFEAVKIKTNEGNSSSKRGGKNQFAKDCNNKREDGLPEHQMLAIDTASVTFNEDMWMCYSSITNHMTPYVKYFTSLDRSYRARVRFRDGNTTMAEGIGDVKIWIKEGIRILKNMLFVHGIDRNILSLLQLEMIGEYNLSFTECAIVDHSGTLFAECLWDEKRRFYLRALD